MCASGSGSRGSRRGAGIFEKYVGEVVTAVSKISGLGERKQKELYEVMMQTAKKRTFKADMELDEDGNPIPPGGGKQRARREAERG